MASQWTSAISHWCFNSPGIHCLLHFLANYMFEARRWSFRFSHFQFFATFLNYMFYLNLVPLHPLEKALAAVLLISYIQPFEDGNKRTARTVGNALLLAADYCPLSYRSADEIEYKKGMILFYEQNDWSYFKTIFTDQFRQGIEKYF